ncbi:hypothetical protein C8R45DRAFT_780146, partial [Mycena sanguinolenta]
ELPSHLQYTRVIEHSDVFQYRLPLITTTRLFLVSYVSALDPAERQKYLDWFDKWFPFKDAPKDFCEIHGPKIVARPADLSPGEYTTLARTMPFRVMMDM